MGCLLYFCALKERERRKGSSEDGVKRNLCHRRTVGIPSFTASAYSISGTSPLPCSCEEESYTLAENRGDNASGGRRGTISITSKATKWEPEFLATLWNRLWRRSFWGKNRIILWKDRKKQAGLGSRIFLNSVVARRWLKFSSVQESRGIKCKASVDVAVRVKNGEREKGVERLTFIYRDAV